jgi:hypothetical protein
MPDNLNFLERALVRKETNSMLNKLQAHWPTIAAVVAVVLPFFKHDLLQYVSLHPHTALGVFMGAVVAAYNSASPTQQAQLAQLVQKLLSQTPNPQTPAPK